MADTPATGSIGWVDLTVENADSIRDFYAAVAGWTPAPLDMGGYNDYVMQNSAGAPVAGVCNARGANEGLPNAWLVYITVPDVDAAAAKCVELGGRLVQPVRSAGNYGSFCVIADPSGAVCALFQAAKSE